MNATAKAKKPVNAIMNAFLGRILAPLYLHITFNIDDGTSEKLHHYNKIVLS